MKKKIELTPGQFLPVDAKTDQLEYERRRERLDLLQLPEVTAEHKPDDHISTAVLLTTALQSLSQATSQLRSSDIAVDMGRDPVELNINGVIQKLDVTTQEVYLKLTL